MAAAALAAAGPDWASIMTAIGTVAVAMAAVGIALWSDKRTDNRIRDEREFAKSQLQAEISAAGNRLKAQQEYSASQLREERQREQDAEQLAEAYLVQVSLGVSGPRRDPVLDDPSVQNLRQLAAVVVNRGRYAITGIEARFLICDVLSESRKSFIRRGGLDDVPEELRTELAEQVNPTRALSSRDVGMRFDLVYPVNVTNVQDASVIIRFTDRWGSRWEHRSGEVRKIAEDEDWKP